MDGEFVGAESGEELGFWRGESVAVGIVGALGVGGIGGAGGWAVVMAGGKGHLEDGD